MKKYVRWFILHSLVYLLAGGLLGVLMTNPHGRNHDFIPTHVHLLLLGFVSMMIYGVAYHVLPRFAGTELYSDRLAWWHFWLASAGVVALGLFFWMNRAWPGRFAVPLAMSGLVALSSLALFVFNIWKTLSGAKSAETAEKSPAANPGDRLIADIMRENPRAKAVFAQFFGAGCFACAGFEQETLAQACGLHGTPLQVVVDALSGKVVQAETPGQPTTLAAGAGCFRCGATASQKPVLWFEYEGRTARVCVHCLPPLIHGR